MSIRARMASQFLATVLLGAAPVLAQDAAAPQATPAPDAVTELQEHIREQDAKLKQLEDEVDRLKQGQTSSSGPAPEAVTSGSPSGTQPVSGAAETGAVNASVTTPADTTAAPMPPPEPESGGHSMSIAGGPVLKLRGFFDFNFGAGSIANPLVFPIIDSGCGTCGNPLTPPHTAFQAGEFDLFMTSKLSDHLAFLGEIVLGPDTTNEFAVDIERYQLTYKANRYFSAGAGRFHTSIGYYNTAYHHGNWFSTAEGRPIMYLFEDSGGILPVHMVGLSFTGAVPKAEKLGLHWIAEVGNGLSSNPFAAESVQNFYSDRNYKATNLAAYIRPELIPGLQIGGSWYHDGIVPTQAQNPLPIPEIMQNIESAYVVYFSSQWESMTEGVLLSNHVEGISQAFLSPMAYTQLARKFGMWKPYFRYQYVRDNVQDPINLLKGTYYGPSVGLRSDFSEYAAFKLQFNHLYESSQLAGNGLNAQLAFTF
jgi:hypothetical protein